MHTYEVSVDELYGQMSESYLRSVVAEVNLRSITDPFFDSVKAQVVNRHVWRGSGRTFHFKFDPGHRGRPWTGPQYRLDSDSMLLSSRGGSVHIRGKLTHESLLDAVREILVQEVMEL